MKNLTLQQLKDFLKERPSINIAGIAREAGFSGRYLTMILDGDRPLSDNAKHKLKNVLVKYGYEEKGC